MNALSILATAVPMDASREPSTLLESARAGDLAAFERLIRQYERLVIVTALRMLGDEGDAQDASQEVCARGADDYPACRDSTGAHQAGHERPGRGHLLDCGNERRLKMKRLVWCAALVMAPLLAQQQAPPPSEEVQKVVKIQYADPQSIQGLLTIFNVATRADPQMKVITLSGPRNRVTAAEEAIKQLDVPGAQQKDIDLTVYFVVGTDQSNIPGNPIPADLQSTVAALKSTFSFENYGLLDVLSLRTRSGARAETSGQFGSRFTTFRIRSASLEGNGMIRLDMLHAGVRNPVVDGPNKINYVDTGISTDIVDIKEGQKLVVGRSSLDGPEKALFLVLIAKVAQ
jgi:hypothetical protein